MKSENIARNARKQYFKKFLRLSTCSNPQRFQEDFLTHSFYRFKVTGGTLSIDCHYQRFKCIYFNQNDRFDSVSSCLVICENGKNFNFVSAACCMHYSVHFSCRKCRQIHCYNTPDGEQASSTMPSYNYQRKPCSHQCKLCSRRSRPDSPQRFVIFFFRNQF